MALQTERVPIGDQHFIVGRTVWFVAGDAIFTLDAIVFEDEGTSHFRVTAKTGIIHPVPGIGGNTVVWIMAIITGDLAFQDTVPERHTEIGHLGRMALQAEFRLVAEIHSRPGFHRIVNLVAMTICTADAGTLVWASCPALVVVGVALQTHAISLEVIHGTKHFYVNDGFSVFIISMNTARAMTSFTS